ncbi:MAG TPA: TlpA disulfide reductase family protein [Gemmatimonadaceae bacterium]
MRNFSCVEPQTSRRPTGGPPRGARRTALLLAVPALLALPGPAGAGPGDDERLTDADFGWELRTLDGRTTTLERFRGRVLFINLWATWCPPCVAELRSIQALADSLADEPDIAFLLVSPETAGPVRRFVRRRAVAAPVYLEGTRAPARLGAIALPTTVIVSRDGRIVLRRRGAADWDDASARELLRDLAR